MLCFKNLEEMLFALVSKAMELYTRPQLKEWINTKTDEDGFSALHFASFRGNINAINLLIDLGADMYARNNFGINVLHVAA
jgi:palmitoyltransferase ZDHHC13/17